MPSNTLLKCLTEPNPQVDNTRSLTGRPTEHHNGRAILFVMGRLQLSRTVDEIRGQNLRG
ncbi:hypothetical protein PABG_11952 [Paracoccidioides brasiliensis Pb03]|nr:hypothetical protein PABG_11952 [Paracoccidioides brasiliensis Pb03]